MRCYSPWTDTNAFEESVRNIAWPQRNAVIFKDGQLLYWNGSNWVAAGGANTLGVTDGSDAQPGQIGEVVTAENQAGANSIIQPMAKSPTAWTVVSSISLSPGDWDIIGGTAFQTPANGTTELYDCQSVIRDTTQTPAKNWPVGWTYQFLTPASANINAAVPTMRYNVTTTTTVYLLAAIMDQGNSQSDVGKTGLVYGYIYARRMR